MYRSGAEYERARDPYEILGMPRSATEADIKSGFRRLAKQLHPDANTVDPSAAERFAALNAAHAILGNKHKRRAFDRGDIDAEGRPVRRAISHAAPSRRSRSGTRYMAMSFLIAASILVATPSLVIGSLTQGDYRVSSVGHEGVASGFVLDGAQARTGRADRLNGAGLTRPSWEPARRSQVGTPLVSPPATTASAPVNPSAANILTPQQISDSKECNLRSEQVSQLIKLSEKFLAQGDVATARRFLERAARARDPRATLMLAATYDPEGLKTMGAMGIQPDLDRAYFWYTRAREFGCHEANVRLMALAEPTR